MADNSIMHINLPPVKYKYSSEFISLCDVGQIVYQQYFNIESCRILKPGKYRLC